MGRRRRSRAAAAVAALALAVVVAACSALPSAPPLTSARYQVTVSCAVPFESGGTWWEFVEPYTWPPPMPSSGGAFVNPYPVPGTVIPGSGQDAIFVADSDGSSLLLRALAGPPPTIGACL
jgi:hypothetical protein